MTGVPPSQHGAAAGAQAGSQAGAHAGAHGCIGAIAGALEQGDRKSMNDDRRQAVPPPKQLLQPLAARRPADRIVKQTKRDMASSPEKRRSGIEQPYTMLARGDG